MDMDKYGRMQNSQEREIWVVNSTALSEYKSGFDFCVSDISLCVEFENL